MRQWLRTKLKYVAEVNRGVLAENTASDFRFVYVDIGDVSQGSVALAENTTALSEAPSRARRTAAPGDVLVSTVRTYLRAIATVPESDKQLVFSTGFAILHPHADVFARFLAWRLQDDEFVARVEANSTGVSYPAITAQQLVALDLQLPAHDEQREIADFLDRETARIDTLIEEQQRLIELLRERRRAAITRAVSNAETVSIQLIRCMTELVDYRGATPSKTDSGVQLITARNVKAGWIDYDSSREFVDPKTYTQVMRRGLPRLNDLLFTMEAPLGNVALVDNVQVALAQRVIKWTVDGERARPRYLLYAMLADDFQFQLRIRSTGSTALGIKASKLPELRVWLPDVKEQERIVAYLDEQIARIDTLIDEAEKFIELSRERRSALITAAVTGQIDVRESA